MTDLTKRRRIEYPTKKLNNYQVFKKKSASQKSQKKIVLLQLCFIISSAFGYSDLKVLVFLRLVSDMSVFDSKNRLSSACRYFFKISLLLRLFYMNFT